MPYGTMRPTQPTMYVQLRYFVHASRALVLFDSRPRAPRSASSVAKRIDRTVSSMVTRAPWAMNVNQSRMSAKSMSGFRF